ncbi:MAG: hypothetical protein DMF61_06680 [Blastocatellia bacterium AA13]|nr:MAG: hypothetical protein DMF61_06680 [Blastocatellia bacterium AA13]
MPDKSSSFDCALQFALSRTAALTRFISDLPEQSLSGLSQTQVTIQGILDLTLPSIPIKVGLEFGVDCLSVNANRTLERFKLIARKPVHYSGVLL